MIEFRINNRYDDPPLGSLKLEPGKPMPMRPTARHLRLHGLNKPLKVGDQFSMILDFLNAGEIEIKVVVAKGPGNSGGSQIPDHAFLCERLVLLLAEQDADCRPPKDP